jgi:hypothetical protein
MFIRTQLAVLCPEVEVHHIRLDEVFRMSTTQVDPLLYRPLVDDVYP